MTEESVTKALLDWLESTGWEVICYDFPQSGTGIALHPNSALRETKNKGSIIPDIIAIRNGVVVFFENKDNFVQKDFDKVNRLRTTTNYSEAIIRLLKEYDYKKIFYGVGLPFTEKVVERTTNQIEQIDFAIFVSEDGSVKNTIDSFSLFS